MFDEEKAKEAAERLRAGGAGWEEGLRVAERLARESAQGQRFFSQFSEPLLHQLRTITEKFTFEEQDESLRRHKAEFKAGDAVSSVWGKGKVQQFRERDATYVVLLDDWKLAQGQSPTLYVSAEALTRCPHEFKAGDAVSTVWGKGKVQQFRERDAIYVVLLDDWKLAQGQSPTLYVSAEALTRCPHEFKAGDAVSTVWGKGKVQQFRERDAIYVVLLDDWKLAQGQSPTLYVSAEALSSRDLNLEAKMAEVKAAHDKALEDVTCILTTVGAIMRRSLPKYNSCHAAIDSFVSLGFIPLVTDCLNKFMHHPPAVNAACWCVMVLCSDNPDNQLALAKAGACEGVMQALSTHAGNPDIIEYVCRAARNLTSNLSIAYHCISSGIGELIACVIILHLHRPAQCEAGLWVVTNLSCDSNNATVLGSIGMCDAVTTVLRTYVNNPTISAAATWTVKNLACGSSFNYSQFIHTDVCESLFAILRNFKSYYDVMSPALWAIANITCDPALSMKMNENSDICQLIVIILSEFIDKTKSCAAMNANDTEENLDVVEASMWALRNIASVGAFNDTLHDNALDCIKQVMEDDFFLSNSTLLDSALAALVNMLSNLPDSAHFKERMKQLGFSKNLLLILSEYCKDESVIRHACKVVCLYATSLNTMGCFDDCDFCTAAVRVMSNHRENELVVQAACEVLYMLYYSQHPSEVDRLVKSGMVTITTESDSTKTEICKKPFEEILAAWLPENLIAVTKWPLISSLSK